MGEVHDPWGHGVPSDHEVEDQSQDLGREGQSCEDPEDLDLGTDGVHEVLGGRSGVGR